MVGLVMVALWKRKRVQKGTSENWIRFSRLREQVIHVSLIMGSNNTLSGICCKITRGWEK